MGFQSKHLQIVPSGTSKTQFRISCLFLFWVATTHVLLALIHQDRTAKLAGKLRQTSSWFTECHTQTRLVGARQSAILVLHQTAPPVICARTVIRVATYVSIKAIKEMSLDVSHAPTISHSGSKALKLVLAHVVLDFMKALKETVALAIRLVSDVADLQIHVLAATKQVKHQIFTKVGAYQPARPALWQSEVFALLAPPLVKFATDPLQFVKHVMDLKVEAFCWLELVCRVVRMGQSSTLIRLNVWDVLLVAIYAIRMTLQTA